MNVFIDTSGLLAVLDGDDANQEEAKSFWANALGDGSVLVCHNYVLVEISALVLRKLGIEAVRVLERDIVPVLRVVWVSREVHEAAVGAHLAAARRRLSLVDCVSFEIMRRTGIDKAFAFDHHFQEYGFKKA